MNNRIIELEEKIKQNNETIADLDLQNMMILEEIKTIRGE